MLDPRYRPGRRRKPLTAALLDWGAGVLLGILATLIGFGVVTLVVDPGLERLGAQVIATFIAWPIGAALGVWLSIGPPMSARGLAYALALTLVGTAIVLIPVWLDVDVELLRGISGVAVLLLAPAFARLGVRLTRPRED